MRYGQIVAGIYPAAETLANARDFNAGHGPKLAQALAQAETVKRTSQLS
jgi:hypothetical protein